MAKTEKLYYENPEQLSCTAVVLDCAEKDGAYSVVLDHTCFFPEGGGQASDTGTIDDIPVTDVREHDDILYHIIDKPLEVGKTVELIVNAKRRKDHCQQHTGEHMISGLAKTLFGAQNVGFHMAETYSTLDLDTFLDDEQLLTLERAVNEKVAENRRIYTEQVTADGLSKLNLRKKTERLEQRADVFRIVYIDGVDSCTCCGSHCALTGEVGVVKFTAWQKYKGGIRIWFLCGERALCDYEQKQDIITRLARRFSTSQDELTECVIRQGDENNALKSKLKQKTTQLCALRAEKLLAEAQEVNGTKVVIICDEGADMFELKTLSDMLIETEKVIAILFSYADGTAIYTAATSKDAPLRANELIKTVNALLNGKGGGRPDFAQGSGKVGSMTQVREAAEALRAYLMKLTINN